MYDLQLTPEQVEMRETIRDFVTREIKPAALHPARLEPFEKPLLAAALTQASQMGLRMLALPEDAGGAGADCLTSCIVMEELGAGDVDIAMALAHTSELARAVFEDLAPEPRKRLLQQFVADDDCHLAVAAYDPSTQAGWSYHRPLVDDHEPAPTAVKQGNGDWVINGTVALAPNAPIAKLIAVEVRTDPKKTGSNGMTTLLVPRETRGLTVRPQARATGDMRGNDEAIIRWHHGPAAAMAFEDCRVPGDHVVGKEGQSTLGRGPTAARSIVQIAAVNLGLGRVAYETAVDYARIRRQGGRNIVEHQSIGGKLADCAIRLELARNMIWKAAWVLDHPDAQAGSGAELPLHIVARVYTAQAMHEVTLLAAECFGGMGVMRDMPLQKYVHDGMVFFHQDDSDDAAKLRIAEALAGYERPLAQTA